VRCVGIVRFVVAKVVPERIQRTKASPGVDPDYDRSLRAEMLNQKDDERREGRDPQTMSPIYIRDSRALAHTEEGNLAHILHHHRNSLPAADAGRGETVLLLAPTQLIEQRDH
jgi:hypothetical protein